ncbi:hypothetical protein DD582_33430 [Klebsiella pneumoniae]|nr:hypothetical protein DD582_33430 [Klebsiella pneumoniae]
MPIKLSAHLRVGFFLLQDAGLACFLPIRSCTALNWCTDFKETVEWQQANCPMLGKSLTR